MHPPSVAGWDCAETYTATERKTSLFFYRRDTVHRGKKAMKATTKRLCFFLFQLQGEHDLFLVIEARDSSSSGLGAIFFGVDFIIDGGIDPTEAVVPLFIGDVAAIGIGARVFQENHS